MTWTLKKFQNYRDKVAHFLTSNDVKPGCFSTVKEEDEGHFSWSPCECCENNLGGTRYDYQFAMNKNGLFEAAICSDCQYYLTYGELDEATMMEIGESSKMPEGA